MSLKKKWGTQGDEDFLQELRRRMDAIDETVQPPVSIAPCMIVRSLESGKKAKRGKNRRLMFRWAMATGLAAVMLIAGIAGSLISQRPQTVQSPPQTGGMADAKLFQPDLSTSQRNSYYDIYLAFEEIRQRRAEKDAGQQDTAALWQDSGLHSYTPEQKRAEPEVDGMASDIIDQAPLSSSEPSSGSGSETGNVTGESSSPPYTSDHESDTTDLGGATGPSYTPDTSHEDGSTGGSEPGDLTVNSTPADAPESQNAVSEAVPSVPDPLQPSAGAAVPNGAQDGEEHESSVPQEAFQVPDTFRVQVPEVDEADIVKSDGNYLYILSRYSKEGWQLSIVSIAGGNMHITSKTNIDFGDTQELELYIDGDHLVILGNLSERLEGMAAAGLVQAQIFDISDRENPVCIRTFRQQGLMAGSRLIDHTLYIVSTPYYPYIQELDVELVKNYLPMFWDSDIGHTVALNPGQIQIVWDTDQGAYCFVAAVDLAGGVQLAATLGGGDVLYSDTENIYVAAVRQTEGRTFSEVLRFSLKNYSISYTGRGRLPGAVGDSLFMNVENGYLQILSQYPDDGGSGLYILDEGLAIAGALEGIAPGQEIQSARFDGDTVYISFAGEDSAVLVVDTADPSSPAIANCFSLPGLSGMLYPLEDGRLLSIGEADGAIALRLFDASNPRAFRVLAQKELRLSGQALQTEAAYSYHAFTYLSDEGMGFLPISTDTGFSGFLAVQLDDRDILVRELLTTAYRSSQGYYSAGSGDWARRTVVVGQTGFAVTDGAVLSFDISDMRQEATLRLYDYTIGPSGFSDMDRTLIIQNGQS